MTFCCSCIFALHWMCTRSWLRSPEYRTSVTFFHSFFPRNNFQYQITGKAGLILTVIRIKVNHLMFALNLKGQNSWTRSAEIFFNNEIRRGLLGFRHISLISNRCGSILCLSRRTNNHEWISSGEQETKKLARCTIARSQLLFVPPSTEYNKRGFHTWSAVYYFSYTVLLDRSRSGPCSFYSYVPSDQNNLC